MNQRFLQNFVKVSSSHPSGALEGSQSSQENEDLPVIVALPRPLVEILERAQTGLPTDFQNWVTGLQEALALESQTILHGAEERCLEDAKQSLLALTKAYSVGQWEEATESAFVCFRTLAHFEVLREKNRQSKLPGVNRFLIATISFLEGRAPSDVVLSRLEGAVKDIDQLVELYKMGEEVLPGVVKQAFLRGIDKASLGVSTIRNWDRTDHEVLRQAVSSLTDGMLLLTTLQDWKDDSDRANSGAVPLAGESVQTMLEQLSESGSIRDKTLSRWEGHWLPQLEAFWNECRPSVLIKYPYRQQIIHELDQTLERLQSLRTLDPNSQRTTLQNLDDLFERMSRFHIDLKNRTLGPKRWKADLLLAVSAGGIPDFYLVRTIEDIRSSGDTEMADALESYRQTGDGAAVIRLLEQVL